MKKLLLLLIFCILLCNLVIAEPPFTQESSLASELTITVPKNEYFKPLTNFTLHFHIFNSSGFLQTNETTDCFFHAYNTSGIHIIEEELSYNINLMEWFIVINDTINHGTMGVAPYVAWCNNSFEGGFISSSFEINDHSRILYDKDTSQSMSLTIFILFCTILLFLMPKLWGSFSENPITDMIITRACYIIGFYLMVMNSGIVASFAISSGYATGELFRYMWLFGMGGYLLMFVTFIKTIFDIAELWGKIVAKNRGFD